MAKKKSKSKKQQQPPLSPYRFMREKARKLPLGKCYIAPPDWQEKGMAQIIISRVRPNGNLVMASFLVDTFCLGVKDAGYHENMTPESFQDYLDNYKYGMGLEEISYEEAHNIIYGAIAFAEDGGIKPSKDFDPAGYILENDTEDIPLIEYDFGKNGKHFLIVNANRREMPFYHILKKNLGDNFEYILPFGEEDDDEQDYDDEYSALPDLDPDMISEAMENMKKMQEESDRHPSEVYAYQYPDYPQTPSVKNQFIADELLSADNYRALPDKVIERILALPKDEAAQDISTVILYEIGRTYKGINEDTIDKPDNSAIMHSLMLLAQIQSEKGLDAVLEIMRQTDTFADYHLGDLASDLLHPALYASGKNNIKAIEDYINQPGLDSYLRSQAPEALAMIVFNHPERRKEIIEVFRRILKSMVTRLPKQEACDGCFAGFLISNLMDIEATELIPEIEALFAIDCVDKSIAVDCDKVIKEIKFGRSLRVQDTYVLPDIYTQYDSYKNLLKYPGLNTAKTPKKVKQDVT